MKQPILSLGLVISFALSTVAIPAPTEPVIYVGELRNSDSRPVPDGSYPVTFSIYSDSLDENALWSGTQPVLSNNGFFITLLDVPNFLFDVAVKDRLFYLGITLNPALVTVSRLRLNLESYVFDFGGAFHSRITFKLAAPVGDPSKTEGFNAITKSNAMKQSLFGVDFFNNNKVMLKTFSSPFSLTGELGRGTGFSLIGKKTYLDAVGDSWVNFYKQFQGLDWNIRLMEQITNDRYLPQPYYMYAK